MATQFLAATQTTSDIIERPGSGDILIYFFGTMHADEKWAIQAALRDVTPANRDWRAIHSIDGLTETGDDVNKWQGPRNNDRQFFFPVEKDFVYRVEKQFGDTQAQPNVTANTTVTACWAPRTTRIYR